MAKEIKINDYLSEVWGWLGRGSKDPKSPFHYPVVGTVSQVDAHAASLRTVILRHCEQSTRSLYFFTDTRSGKIEELNMKGQITWLFYHPSKKLQITVHGKAKIHLDDEIAENFRKNLPPKSHKDYAGKLPPGATLGYTSKNPGNLIEEDNLESVFSENFGVVETVCHQIESLQLNKTQHDRVRHIWNGKDWESLWIAP